MSDRMCGDFLHMQFKVVLSAAILAVAAALCIGVSAAGALPNGRAYELVTRVTDGGHEEGVSGVNPNFAAVSMEGGAVDWEWFGGCCPATPPAQTPPSARSSSSCPARCGLA